MVDLSRISTCIFICYGWHGTVIFRGFAEAYLAMTISNFSNTLSFTLLSHLQRPRISLCLDQEHQVNFKLCINVLRFSHFRSSQSGLLLPAMSIPPSYFHSFQSLPTPALIYNPSSSSLSTYKPMSLGATYIPFLSLH